MVDDGVTPWRRSDAEPIDVSFGRIDRTGALNLAASIVDVARDLSRSVPWPRGAPYFHLDTGVPYDLGVFDALSGRGIFRKYEFALEIGSGMGGRARWLAARTGCRILGVDPCAAVVAAAATLNRRARMDDQVNFLVARPDRLPLRERVFTHVWLLSGDGDAENSAGLREAFRVLRRGGHFAVQAPILDAASRTQLTHVLQSVGFDEIEVCEAVLSEIPHACRIARERLCGALRSQPELLTRWREADRWPAERGCLQIFARRPA